MLGVLFVGWMFSGFAFAQDLKIGEVPPVVTLQHDQGGRINGEPWSSGELKGVKVTSFFYVDPEEKAQNEALEEAYKKNVFPHHKHQGVAIINMAAAWYPNAIINTNLEAKQKEFPLSTYVKDMNKTLVKSWGLADDAVNVIIFGKDSKILFMKKGAVKEPQEIEAVMDIIRKNI